ncbi:MAG: LamG domain-containing protein, partial [Lentisphaerae bacterium]|nr:LamG domain-containing protein [Lentisphaerota bacterium]
MVLVRKTLLILAGAMSLAASAVDEGDVLFFAPFEGESVAATAVGAPDAEIDGAVRFGSGVRGRAAILDPLTLLRYTFKDNVVPDEGTIMMWIKPEWLFSDDKFHYLFRASTGNFGGKSLNAMMLYKYGRWSRLLFYTSNGQKTDPQEGRSMAFRNELKPTPGEWVHVAATWSSTLASTEMFLYVNGERVAACGGAVFLPETIPETFSLGGPEGAGTTWFDDVLILNRPLLAAEVKHIHDASTSSTAVQSPADIPFQPSSELQIEAYPLFRCGELVVESDFRGARRALGSAPGSISVELSRGGKSLVSGSAVAGQSGLAGVSFPYAAIGPGVTQVVATLRTAAGRVLRRGELTDCLVPQRPDWVGNDLGKTDRVLPPWTPLQAREDGIAMWGREYEFAEGPLPSRIVSQGRELLRAPVAMAGRVAGKPSTLQAERSSRTSEGEAEIVREWQGMFGELTGRITQRVEFDGFMLLSLELTPTAPTVVEELHIRIPFASVSLFHHANGTWSNLSDAGGIGGAVGWQKALPFVPYVWVGDASGGLAWFCESDWNWHPRGAAHAIDLSRTGDGVDLTIRLIDEPTVLSEPLRLEFGFMATPVKPLVSGWRDWRPMFVSALNIPAFARGRRWSTPGCRNIAVLWNNHVGAFSHLPTDPQDFRTKVDTLR